MSLIINNASLLTREGFRKGAVAVQGRRICGVTFGKAIKPSKGEKADIINAKGHRLVPGMIDMHFHGMGRIDSNHINETLLEKLERELLQRGVTAFLPTFYSISYSSLKKNLIFYRDYLNTHKGRTNILGINLEGPFLNKKQGGSHDKKLLTGFHNKKYIELIREYSDIIRIITVSPELDGADKAIKCFTGWGIKVMAGHTLATFDEVGRSFHQGVCGITHFYNRVTPFHHREVGVIGAAFLKKNIFVELIADGLHSCVNALQIAFNNIDNSRIIFVSDQIVAPKKVFVLRGGQGCRGYLDEENKFVGGGSSLLSCIEFARKNLDIGFAAAWDCVSRNPAKMLGIERYCGEIKKGAKADLLVIDGKGKIRTIIKSGENICVE